MQKGTGYGKPGVSDGNPRRGAQRLLVGKIAPRNRWERRRQQRIDRKRNRS